MHAQDILSAHPQLGGRTSAAMIRCIEHCYDCAQACTACADACLGEPMVQQMTQCIRTCLDCADVCMTTGTLGSRRTGSNAQLVARMLQICEDACRICAQECLRHGGDMLHCRVCADACLECESACREAAASMIPTLQ